MKKSGLKLWTGIEIPNQFASYAFIAPSDSHLNFVFFLILEIKKTGKWMNHELQFCKIYVFNRLILFVLHHIGQLANYDMYKNQQTVNNLLKYLIEIIKYNM